MLNERRLQTDLAYITEQACSLSQFAEEAFACLRRHFSVTQGMLCVVGDHLAAAY